MQIFNSYLAFVAVMTGVPSFTHALAGFRVAYVIFGARTVTIAQLASVEWFAPVSSFAAFTAPSLRVSAVNTIIVKKSLSSSFKRKLY